MNRNERPGPTLYTHTPTTIPGKRPRRTAVIISATALAAALIGGAGGATVVTLAESPGTGGTAGASAAAVPAATGEHGADVSATAAKVLPSVVQINTRTAGGEAIGSGVVLSAEGRILTNAHVVADAVGPVTVTLDDGRTYQARVAGTDSKADIAVLQADGASGLSPAAIGDSATVAVGSQVVAIGSPGGLQNTVTSGIVSATGRDLDDVGGQATATDGERGTGPSYTAIQTDAAINQGNSGGPLVNAAGQVIGINSAIYSPSAKGNIGIGFAIPINDAITIADRIGDS